MMVHRNNNNNNNNNNTASLLVSGDPGRLGMRISEVWKPRAEIILERDAAMSTYWPRCRVCKLTTKNSVVLTACGVTLLPKC
jgi:hypothetical protein